MVSYGRGIEGKETQEVFSAGLGYNFAPLGHPFCIISMGSERKRETWTRGCYEEAKSEERVSRVRHESMYCRQF